MQQVDIEVKFTTLWRGSIRHAYYTPEQAGDFVWIPTPATQGLWRELGLLMNIEDDGWRLAISSEHYERFLVVLERYPQMMFQFLIATENPYFKHFTDLPLSPTAPIAYLDGKMAVSSAPSLPLSYSPQLTHKSQKKGTEIALRAAEQTIITHKTTKADESIALALPAEQYGKYTLTENDKEVYSFLYAPFLPARLRPLAFMSLSLGKDDRKALVSSLQNNQSPKALEATTEFAARATHWRYYIVAKYTDSLKGLVAETDAPNIKFGAAKTTTMPNGETAAVIESQAAIALHKTQLPEIRLLRRQDAKGKAIEQTLTKLPTPAIDRLRPEAQDKDAKIWSEMLVYV